MASGAANWRWAVSSKPVTATSSTCRCNSPAAGRSGGDVALVGYGNTSYCDLAPNSLTSIDQSGQVFGLQAARLLTERIKGRQVAEHFVVTPRLAARASSRPARAAPVPAPAT